MHEDGTGACSSCPCPEYEPACVYCGDEGVVVEGDAEVPCGQCFELD